MTIFIRYMCEQCGREHESENSAYKCCPVVVCKRYCCSICTDGYSTEESAIECFNSCEANLKKGEIEASLPDLDYVIPALHDPESYIKLFIELNHLTP